MPGSLFPRSPSLVPDGHDSSNDGRHVHFTPPQPKRRQDLAPDPENDIPGPSRRPPNSSSVKAAVDRFNTGGDADPSILLPTPHTSPARAGKAREKRRAIESWDDPKDGDTSNEMRVRGKERELVAARKELQRHDKRQEQDGELKEAEREKVRDKERIRLLEEEITWLKQEVGRFDSSGQFLRH